MEGEHFTPLAQENDHEFLPVLADQIGAPKVVFNCKFRRCRSNWIYPVKMKNIVKIEETLDHMARLLRFAGIPDWAIALAAVCKQVRGDTDSAIQKILSMYGGMGSLNDIVLYLNGQPLPAENKEFDRLRTNLFNLCRQ
jgi:hypothetical protein